MFDIQISNSHLLIRCLRFGRRTSKLLYVMAYGIAGRKEETRSDFKLTGYSLLRNWLITGGKGRCE